MPSSKDIIAKLKQRLIDHEKKALRRINAARKEGIKIERERHKKPRGRPPKGQTKIRYRTIKKKVNVKMFPIITHKTAKDAVIIYALVKNFCVTNRITQQYFYYVMLANIFQGLSLNIMRKFGMTERLETIGLSVVVNKLELLKKEKINNRNFYHPTLKGVNLYNNFLEFYKQNYKKVPNELKGKRRNRVSKLSSGTGQDVPDICG